MLDEIRDIVEEQAPGERNAAFRMTLRIAAADALRIGVNVAVPCDNDHQRRVVEMVAAVMRRGH